MDLQKKTEEFEKHIGGKFVSEDIDLTSFSKSYRIFETNTGKKYKISFSDLMVGLYQQKIVIS